ncbi:MAG: hypothetical protein F4015_12360 [Acidimicrobiia bacterium]|nr:hypothetical protein [Acidimicrobiia bacterium]
MIGAFTGVLALGLILVPGFSYRIGRESGRESGLAAKRPLGFRETALLIVPGFLATFAGLCAFAVIRAVRPSNTPDVGGIAENPGLYMSDHLSYVFWWCAVVLGIASGLAFFGGLTVTRWLVRQGRTQHSSWYDWLEHPDGDTVVYCHLTDGSIVAGILLSFNEDYEETEERDLCLLDPWYWPPDDSEERGERYEWYDDIAIISASRIQFLRTSSVPEDESEAEDADDAD